MAKKSFDVEKFVDSIEDEAEEVPVEAAPVVKPKKLVKCPRCGAKKWEYMRYSSKGQVLYCSECRSVDVQ